MKKFTIFFTFMLIFIITIMFACNGGSSNDKDELKNLPITKTSVRGIAAIGAVLPEGSPVEVRGTTTIITEWIENEVEVEVEVEVPCEDPEQTGCTEIQTQIQTVMEEQIVEYQAPSNILTTTVQEDGYYEVDTTYLEGPYLIRIKDEIIDEWYYSVGDSGTGIANVNPITSELIRSFYNTAKRIEGNLYQILFEDLDNVFTTGVYVTGSVEIKPEGEADTASENTPICMPNIEAVNKAKEIIANSLSLMYNQGDKFDDIITGEWEVGVGFDGILDRMNESTYSSICPTTSSVVRFIAEEIFNRSITLINSYVFYTKKNDPVPNKVYYYITSSEESLTLSNFGIINNGVLNEETNLYEFSGDRVFLNPIEVNCYDIINPRVSYQLLILKERLETF